MRIVLASQGFRGFGGSETYLLTVAHQLGRLGHAVTVYAKELGPMSRLAEERGVPVGDAAGDLPDRCDALLVQDGGMALELAARYPAAPQVFVAHSPAFDFQLPPQVDGVTGTVVVLNDAVRRRVEALAISGRVVRLRQPVDLRRFNPQGRTSPKLGRLLLLGNYLRGGARELLEDACAQLGVECRALGRHGSTSRPPEHGIAEADAVVGYGRGILEAMSSGRPAFVYDHLGGDGWVTPERYPALEANGFAGSARAVTLDRDALRRELAAYDPAMGPVNRALAGQHHGAQTHAQELVTLLRGPARSEPPHPPDQLEEMARLERRAWAAERRSTELQLRTEELQEAVRELNGSLATLTATRRYRLASGLARPLDGVRRRRRG